MRLGQVGELLRGKRQYVAAILANLSIACMGSSLAWTSPVESKLRNPEKSPLDTLPSENEFAWIGSTVTLGSLTGPMIAGLVAHRFGRKVALLSSGIFYALSYVLFATAGTVAQIIVGRFLQGCGIGFAVTVTPLYVCEIATSNRRGLLGSLLQTFITIGIVFVYAVGPYVGYTALQLILLVVPIAFFVSFLFMPETPHYYISKGNVEAAVRSLELVRGLPRSGIQQEFNEIQQSVEVSMRERGTLRDLFRGHANVRALIICTGAIVFQQLSGINPVQFFTQQIFEKTGINIPPEVAAIIIGVVQVLASVLTVVLSDKIGRRPFLLFSAGGMCCSLAALGAYFYLDHSKAENLDDIAFLPLLALIVYVIAFCVGFGPIAWLLIGEMFAPNIKSLASSIVSSICWAVAFFLIFYFNSLNEAIGSHWLFWAFGICCGAAFLFSFFFVVETKGLTLPEIQARLNESARIINVRKR